MNKSYLSLASLLAVAAMGAGMAPSASSPVQSTQVNAATTQTNGVTKSPAPNLPTASAMAAFFDRLHKGSSSRTSYPNGPGWGIRTVQRMARKKRNVKANRRNHRN